MMKQKSNEIRYPSEEESHRAARLAVILVLVGMALLPLLWMLDGYITAIGKLEEKAAITAMIQLVYVLAGLIILISSGIATWIWRVAARIRLSGQYPPPDMMILKPIQVRREKAAMQIARIASILSTLLLLLGFVIALLLVGIVETLQ